jgi:hypothetical protein
MQGRYIRPAARAEVALHGVGNSVATQGRKHMDEGNTEGHESMRHTLLFDVLPRAGQPEKVSRREWKATNNITPLTGAVIGLEAQARSHEKGGVSRALTGYYRGVGACPVSDTHN